MNGVVYGNAMSRCHACHAQN